MLELLSIHTILVHIPLGATGYDLSWIEAVGTVLGLINIWLASREVTLNYLFGIANVLLFMLVFYQIQLYASMLLQVFFLVANGVGWYLWHKSDTTKAPVLVVRWMSVRQMIVVTMLSIVAIGLLASYIDTVFLWLGSVSIRLLGLLGITFQPLGSQPDPYPLADAAVTILSLVATVMMVRKYVENWIIWCAINVLSVWLYARQGVYFMSLEYLVLVFIAGFGAWHWVLLARQQRGTSAD